MIPISRGESLSWACSLALHLPLFLWQGGPLSEPEAPVIPLEIGVSSEAELGLGARAGEPGGSPGPSAPAAPKPRAAAAPAPDPWKGFKASDVWGKVKGGGGGGASARRAERETLNDGLRDHAWPAKLAERWEAKNVPPASPAPARGIKPGEGASSDAAAGPASLSASPWGGGSGSGGKGSLAGGGEPAGASGMEGGSGGGIASQSWEAGSGGGGGSGGGSGFRQGGGSGGALYDLRGPVARRSVLRSRLPRYPEWAIEQGFEADVTVYFVVLPDGRVKTPILVRKTSGDPGLDSMVLESLAEWRFAPLPGGRREEQWGLLTFRFRLKK